MHIHTSFFKNTLSTSAFAVALLLGGNTFAAEASIDAHAQARALLGGGSHFDRRSATPSGTAAAARPDTPSDPQALARRLLDRPLQVTARNRQGKDLTRLMVRRGHAVQPDAQMLAQQMILGRST